MPKTIKSGVLYRTIELKRADVNDEDRTFDVSFSSEEPVPRWDGDEILDHDPKSVRLGRLEAGGAFLVGHDSRDHVGVVESVSIDSDRRGRAKIRLGKSERATEIFNDIKDGIRKFISVGYRVYTMVREVIDKKNDMDVYRVTDWEPLEISLVSVPADITVGVGRQLEGDFSIQIINQRGEDMPDPVKKVPPEEKTIKEIDVRSVENKARAEEKQRLRSIHSLGEKFDRKDMAEKFIEDGRSVEQFRESVMDDIERTTKEEPQGSAADIGLSDKEVRKYSLFNVVRALASGEFKDVGFELECSRAIEENVDKEARGIFIPWDVQSRSSWDTRATPPMNTTDQGNLVPTDLMSGNFIDTLRAESVAMRAGVRPLTGLNGNIDIPRKTANAAFGWIAEGDDENDTDIETGSIQMSPKTIAGGVPITRRLLRQASQDAESLIRGDIIEGIGLAIDLGILQGTGASGQPRGIINTTGIGTAPVSSAGDPTWAEVVAFETAVAIANGLSGSLNMITTPGVRGNMKVKSKDVGSGRFVCEENVVNGYDVLTTTQIVANRILFGNYADVILAMWGILDITVDTSTLAKSGGRVIRAFQDVDVAVRRAASFVKNV